MNAAETTAFEGSRPAAAAAAAVMTAVAVAAAGLWKVCGLWPYPFAGHHTAQKPFRSTWFLHCRGMSKGRPFPYLSTLFSTIVYYRPFVHQQHDTQITRLWPLPRYIICTVADGFEQVDQGWPFDDVHAAFAAHAVRILYGCYTRGRRFAICRRHFSCLFFSVEGDGEKARDKNRKSSSL